MTKRIRVERALTLSNPSVGWVVIHAGFGAYFPTWAAAMAFAWRIVARVAVDYGVACRHGLHELCHTDWCVCDCHGSPEGEDDEG